MALSRSSGRIVALIVVIGMVLSIVLASVVSFYASSAPDGLERVAEETGFDAAAQGSVTDGSPVAGYAVGDDEGRFSVGMAGLLGVGVTAGLAFGLFAWLRPRDDTPTR